MKLKVNRGGTETEVEVRQVTASMLAALDSAFRAPRPPALKADDGKTTIRDEKNLPVRDWEDPDFTAAAAEHRRNVAGLLAALATGTVEAGAGVEALRAAAGDACAMYSYEALNAIVALGHKLGGISADERRKIVDEAAEATRPTESTATA